MTTTTDQNNGSTGGLSLREAILTANNNTNNDYVILLQSGLRYFLTLSGNDDVGAVGDLDIVNGSNVSIKTTGTSSATINGAGLTQRDGIFSIASGGTVRLENIVVTGGQGGIYNAGDLTIVNSPVTNNSGGTGIYSEGSNSITRLVNTTVSGNSRGILNSDGRLEIVNSTINNNSVERADGGGIRNSGGSFEIVNSTINNNSSSGGGGGIYNYRGNWEIVNSTINNNSSGGGGGIYSEGGSFEIVNSTINNNSSSGDGGGLFLDNRGRGNLVNTTISSNSGTYGGGILSTNRRAITLFLNNVTVANNRASSDGGGIYNSGFLSTYYLTHTLIAGNTIGSSTADDVYGNFFGDSYNLIGNTTGSTGFGGTDLVNVNARFGPLQNNGGPTFTHALLAGSPAINGGNNFVLYEDTFDLDGDGITNEPLAFDQRGLARISGAAVDIGAFEVQTTSPLPTITLALSPASVTEDGSVNLIYTFTRSGASLTNPLTVNYGVTGTATNGTDYGNIGTSVTFAANSSTTTVTVDPTVDTVVEADETVSLTLVNNAAYTVGTTSAVTGTITNDDTAPTLPRITLTLNPSGISEDSPSNFIYAFTRTGSLSNALTVNFSLGGTATLNTDYSLSTPANSITFAANAATASLTINPTADTLQEANETVSLSLTNSTNYVVGTSGAVTATIINDDLTRRQQATTGNDVILGTTRGDILSGGTGNDTLTGGANGDSFNFNNPNEGIDTITDFTPNTDLILVSAAGFGGGLASGDITNAKFFRGTAATNANQRFIYNPTSGSLSFDRDGNGSLPAVQFASLSTNLALTFEDIFVV